MIITTRPRIVVALRTMTIVGYFSAQVKCTNDMARFNKIHTVEDNDDEETVERLKRIGLQFGTQVRKAFKCASNVLSVSDDANDNNNNVHLCRIGKL